MRAERLGSEGELARVREAVAAQVREFDDEGLMLYAGTNAWPLDSSPQSLEAHLSARPSMGDPGAKVQPGLGQLEVVEELTAAAVARTVNATWADVRPPSATLANLAVYAGLTEPGATLAVLPAWAGGHTSHRAEGAAGIRGHRVVELPFDPEAFDLDLAALPGFLARERPGVIVLGGSLFLFPLRLRELSALAREAGASVLYDASHVAGLIAGGRFQDPLEEGADVVTFSTYKSYGGPPGGVIAARDADLFARVSEAVYPGLTANYDAGRLPGLHRAALELSRTGPEQAARCIEAAQALAGALAGEGLELLGAERGYTQSHHLAVTIGAPEAAAAAVAKLEAAGVYLSTAPVRNGSTATTALRLGTQELVRRGLGAAEMPAVAELIARVLVAGERPERVKVDVRRFHAERMRSPRWS